MKHTYFFQNKLEKDPPNIVILLKQAVKAGVVEVLQKYKDFQSIPRIYVEKNGHGNT